MSLNAPNITEILRSVNAGERAALDALVPLVYDELHRQARSYLRRERSNHTIQTTALINEAYLRLAEQKNVRWESRTHFFAIAAQMMRRILVDYAKTRHRAKRGGKEENLSLDEALSVAANEQNIDLLALDAALERLAENDAQQARIVELRYFGDLTIEETARVLGISETTVKRDWTFARAWLHHELTR